MLQYFEDLEIVFLERYCTLLFIYEYRLVIKKSSISELDPVGDVINDSATETLARILVKGLSAAHSADDKLLISWSKG